MGYICRAHGMLQLHHLNSQTSPVEGGHILIFPKFSASEARFRCGHRIFDDWSCPGPRVQPEARAGKRRNADCEKLPGAQ